MSSNVNKSVHFELMFLELIQIRDECKVRIGGQSKQYGAELQEMINLNGFISQWSVDGTTAVETDESKMKFAPLPLEKIKGVNQNWLHWPFALFQVVGPHLHKNVSITNNKYQLLPYPFLPPVALLKNK